MHNITTVHVPGLQGPPGPVALPVVVLSEAAYEGLSEPDASTLYVQVSVPPPPTAFVSVVVQTESQDEAVPSVVRIIIPD